MLGGAERLSLTQPSPAGRGLLAAYAHARTPDAPTVIPAQAGIQPPGIPGLGIGRGVDSRFRGNDGGGGNGGVGCEWRLGV